MGGKSNLSKVPGYHYGNAIYKNFENWKEETGRGEVTIYSWNVNGFNAVTKKKDFKQFLN